MSLAMTRRSTDGRWLFLGLALLGTWAGREFDGPTLWYSVDIKQIPLEYLLLVGVLGVIAPAILATPQFSVASAFHAIGLWKWVVLAWLALVQALAIGVFGQAPELFADWRNLIVLAVVAGACARGLRSQGWGPTAILDLAVAYGLLSLGLVASYGLGQGVSVLGVRSPVFHGPTLFMAVFAALVCISVWLDGLRGLSTIRANLIRIAALSASLLVVLSFRRSFWLALVLGLAGLFGLQLKRRTASRFRVVAAMSIMAIVACVGFAALGTDRVVDRLASFVPSSDNEFAVTNQDHINDLVDAMGVVRASPILGLGIGRYYETTLITDWKTTSFEVHNAPIHVWLKFGLVGLIAYLGFHIRWIRSSLALEVSPTIDAVHLGTGLYLAAEFVATLVGTWPYGSFQMSVFHGVLLGGLLASTSTKTDRRETRPLLESRR